jgi:hypothetical protein
MKRLLFLLLILSLNCFATEVRLIDKNGLLQDLHSKLASKSLDSFQKGDYAMILIQGQLLKLKVKKANSKSVTLVGGKKMKISADEFKAAKNNMMNIILRDSNVKVTVNGTVTENTYVVNSVKSTTHILDDGTQIPAEIVRISTPDFNSWSEPMVRMKFVLSAETPGIAQLLKMEMNEMVVYDLRAYESAK